MNKPVVNPRLKKSTQKRLKNEVDEFEGKYFIELNPWFFSYSKVEQDRWDEIFKKDKNGIKEVKKNEKIN